MPGLILTDANMNVHRPASNDRSLKYPPGLGYGNIPGASMSSPALVSPQKNFTRRRSGSFTFTSGSTFATGNIFHGGYNTLTRPFPHEPSSPPSRLGKRSAVAAGLYSQPQHRSGGTHFGSDGPSDLPPPRSHQGSTSFFDFSTTPSTKFDPFGSEFDEQPSLPPASSTSYSHYWEYDPSINGPKLRSTPPKKSSSLLASPRPRTIELPPPTPRPASRPRTSPPVSPTYKSTPTLAPLSAPDRNARSKLLAGILLNRIYAVGKPMRRRLGLESDYYNRQYVKSGLSSVITIDC